MMYICAGLQLGKREGEGKQHLHQIMGKVEDGMRIGKTINLSKIIIFKFAFS